MAKRLNRLKTVPDEFLKKLSPVQRKVFQDIFLRLSTLEVKDGEILKSKKNFAIIDALTDEIHDELLKSEYHSIVKEFVAEFDAQKNLNKTYYETTFDSTFPTLVPDRVVSSIKRQVVQSLVTDSVKADFLSPLYTTLDYAVSSGAGFNSTIELIRNFVEGSEDADGAILRYSKQLAHDSFANSDRGYNSAVADELDIDWFLWAGGEIATTRCFCGERHGKYYHYKEIEAWGRLENLGECRTETGWAGMNRATDEKTIFTYGGGYGCMHTVAGVSIFSVPKEDVVRNIENGNYEVSKTEAEFFGI